MRPIFKTDLKQLAQDLLLIDLREPLFIAFLHALIEPFIVLQNTFNSFRSEIKYELSINGQVCYLQKALNDSFDNVKRRITIGESKKLQSTYIYRPLENRPLYLYRASEAKPPRYIYTQKDYMNLVDFNVNLNGVVLTAKQLADMRQTINKYKLPTIKYKII